jgi:16S rRNA (cytosine967-C5)-methyltransferase
MIAPARVAAYDALTAVASGRADLPTALAEGRAALQDERDRALATEIATGVQRWRAKLDHLIAHFAMRDTGRLDPEILEILRLSVYQLLHLTRVPAAAVVDDAVNLAKKTGKASASGLVNAVLRALSRRRSSLPLPGRPAATGDREAVLAYFSITLSHPRWLAARWYDRLGFEAAERWLLFNNQAAPLTIRTNRLTVGRETLVTRLGEMGVKVSPGRYAPDALIIEAGNPLNAAVAPEWFVVQDEASQLITLLAGPNPGPDVLDACAAPGGKTTALAAAARPGSRVIACDVRDRRMALLRRTVELARAGNVRMVQADLLAALPFRTMFDCVLVDAPCSGLGILRRDPDIRWRRREEELLELSSQQLKMLRHAAAAVAPAGRLVYATCSSEPEENEHVAGAFQTLELGFVPVDAARAHPDISATLVDRNGHLRTSPHAHGLEAFFGAVYERRL